MEWPNTTSQPPGFWGKLDREEATWHPVLDHSADVAACAEALLTRTVLGKRLATLAGRSELTQTDVAWLTLAAGLHDIGKFNNGFQRKAVPGATDTAGHVSEGLALMTPAFRRVLAPLPANLFNDDFASLLAAAICHHGRPQNCSGSYARQWRAGQHGDPKAAVSKLIERFLEWLPLASEATTFSPSNEFIHAFSGLAMLADWIGSSRTRFPYAREQDSEDRFAFARRQAALALKDIGADMLDVRLALGNRPPDFDCVLPFPPRPTQAAISQVDATRSGSVTILEAETGSGKTEAALWHFLRLQQAGQVDGLYFALPTRTAATQIYTRLQEFASRAYGDSAPPVTLAVPGYLSVDGQAGQRLEHFKVLWPDMDRFKYRGWAAEHPKRYLAGAIVVGTIDQVLLSALRVSHAHMRSTSLLRSLLIVDEVHASSPYMNKILESVLREHVRAGGHALLMSATLADSARCQLLNVCGSDIAPLSLAEARTLPYPRIESVAGRASDVIEVNDALSADAPFKRVNFELSMDTDPIAVAQAAVRAAEEGARVVVLRNTVKGCLQTQAAVEELAVPGLLFRCNDLAAPHHSRFAHADRTCLDQALIRRFGKDAPPGGCVVVSTQTIQQSLDLDADYMITDLCPMDVLLQRVGRLHRHQRDERPPEHAEPRCMVLTPGVEGLEETLNTKGESRGGEHGWGTVYQDLRVLARTHQVLSERAHVAIPADNRALVEDVLHPDSLATISARSPQWERHGDQQFGGRAAERQHAGLLLLDRQADFLEEAGLWERQSKDRKPTRLGEDDRRLVFSTPMLSPFGGKVLELNIPERFVPGTFIDEPIAATTSSGGFEFTYGPHTFVYDRCGYRAAEEDTL